MATTEQKCANCEKTGLPILPVRYTVLPKTIAAKLPAGVTGQGVTDVALTEHHYGLRTLRAGWLYLFYITGARGSNYWEAYNVTEDGRLWKQSLPLPAEAKTDPACAQKAIAVQMDIIAIERPEKCTEVYLAFSQHPWLKDTFDRYAGNAALRKRRMQCIEPAKWIAGGTTGDGHAAAATVANIDDVIEYMPGLAPDLLQPRDKPIVDKNGVVDQSVAEHESTRYSLRVRQATPASASDALVKLMHQVGETKHGKSHPPMLLALWDGVGNVHELNGFRNDATGRLVQYYHKQSMQIDAMQAIDAAKVAISQGAVASKSRWRSALRAGWEAMLNSSPAGLDGIPTAPIEQSPEDIAASQQRIANAGKISQKEAKEIGDAAWPKYEEKLDRPKLKAFRNSFDAFHAKVDSLQSKRTHDVGAWLGAPVFIHTLEDYNHHHLSDGVEYEKVIAEAVFGLGSEPEGAKLLDKLVAQIHPTKAECVFWRAMALNQVEVKTELEQILAAAEAHKDTPLDTAKEGINQLLETLEKFKKFAELYEKFNGLANQAKPTNVTDKVAQLTHVDKLMASAGSAVFRLLGVKQLGDYVGEKVVHGLCLVRAGLPKADMKSLIVEEAKRDGKLRTELMNRLRQLRASGMAADAAFFQSAQELAATEGSKSMRAKWAEVLSGKEAVEATTGMRVAVVVLLIEAAGFAKILAKSDKTDADYASLYASGLSVVGATLNLALPLKSIFGNASQSANVLKALGGFAGGAAACITAVTDIQVAADAAHRKNGAETTFLILKVTLGGLGAFANFATALSSSAPLIERLAGRKGYVIFLEKVGTGISDAAARRAALAAGEAVAELAGERAVMMGFGRAILYLAGWEVAVAITLVQVLVWYFSDDDLQIWFSKCEFGIAPADNPRWTVEKQDQEFAKALEKVGLSTQKQAE